MIFLKKNDIISFVYNMALSSQEPSYNNLDKGNLKRTGLLKMMVAGWSNDMNNSSLSVCVTCLVVPMLNSISV